jgi:hypothetical protein
MTTVSTWKSLKMLAGYSEVVIRRRRIDNTMVKRKETKRQKWSTKYYTENQGLSNTSPTKTWVPLKGRQVLLQ